MQLPGFIDQKPVFKGEKSKINWRAVRERKKVLAAAKKRQTEGLESNQIFKLSVEAKLKEAGAHEYCRRVKKNWMVNFERCSNEPVFIMCVGCAQVRETEYRCNLKWCPECNWKISLKRKTLLEKMCKGIYGVKHVVLTQKNFESLTREKILESRKNLANLRRKKIFGKVSGGCASLEFTNEKQGWHMHWHLLVQSPFIPGGDLAVAWGKLVGQEFAIVKVMDVDDKSYLQEILKYVVKGSELAKWDKEKILEFVVALQSTRCFSTFGQFGKLAKFARVMIAQEKVATAGCECGCCQVVVGSSRAMCTRLWLAR